MTLRVDELVAGPRGQSRADAKATFGMPATPWSLGTGPFRSISCREARSLHGWTSVQAGGGSGGFSTQFLKARKRAQERSFMGHVGHRMTMHMCIYMCMHVCAWVRMCV